MDLQTLVTQFNQLITSGQTNEKGELFLINVNQFAPQKGATVQIRAAYKHELLASRDFITWETTPKATGNEQSDFDDLFISSKLMDNQGLDSVKNITAVRCEFPFCTFGNEDFIFF